MKNGQGVLIKWTGASKNISQVKAHVKYVGFRSKEAHEKGFFSRDENKARYEEFIDRVKTNPALQHSSTIKAQKLVFSLREQDYEAYKRSGKDYKDLIRSTLGEYEKKNGMKLDWIANVHEKEGHPHVHVIIKGVSDTEGDRGFKRVYVNKEDFKNMRDTFNKEFERDVKYKWHERIDIGKELDKTMNDMSKSIEAVARAIEKEVKKEQMKAEYDREMQSKKGKERER